MYFGLPAAVGVAVRVAIILHQGISLPGNGAGKQYSVAGNKPAEREN
jgi:hypothetical protein